MSPHVGYALRKQNRSLAAEPAWTGVEIEFFRASHPLRLAPYLTGVPFDYVSIHSLELSVASPEPPLAAHVDELANVARENGAVAISDHLAFTRAGGIGVGQVATTPFRPVVLDAVCRNIDFIQRRLGGVRFFLENMAHFFRLQGTMSEPEFLSRVLTRTGCGWLLDVTNVYHNSLNFGDDPLEFIQGVVGSASRIQMHLSGGYVDEESGKYIDSHNEPIPEPVWDLYREALRLGRGRVEAVFIERDGNFPDSDGWLDEVRHARRIADEVEAES